MGVQEDFSALYSEEQELVKRAGDLQAVISSFFDLSNADYLQQKLIEYKISTGTAQRSVGVESELDFRMRNFFHFPLAFPYRLLEQEFEPARIQYQLHRVSEGVASYVAGLLLSILGPIPKELVTYTKSAFGGNGATFGNWFQIIRRCVQHLDEDSCSFQREMKYILSRTGEDAFLTSMESLLQSRDAFHHKGILEGDEAQKAIMNIRGNLSSALRQLSILIRHPLYLPLDFDSVRDAPATSVTALNYSGDHPGMRKIQIDLTFPPKKNDLYIAVDDGKDWRSIFPFITVQQCSQCKTRETYYIDQWKYGSPAKLKSFERGHLVESVEVGDALANLLS